MAGRRVVWSVVALATAGRLAFVISQVVAASQIRDDGTDAYGMFMVSAIFTGAVLVGLLGLFLWLAVRSERAVGPRPPGGWYPDPQALARLRYWDGGQWTEHVQS